MNIQKLIEKAYTNYLVETCLITCTILVIAGVIIFEFVIKSSETLAIDKPFTTNQQVYPSEQLMIDINGSVASPGAYMLPFGSRLKDAIEAAGGLTRSTDKGFFSRNFNLAQFLSDQQKIYIPSISEVQQGKFRELDRVINAPESLISDKKSKK